MGQAPVSNITAHVILMNIEAATGKPWDNGDYPAARAGM
jgi:hypothetical protein